MRKIKEIYKNLKNLEKKQKIDLKKICLLSFFIALTLGLFLGFIFREYRLDLLENKQKAQRMEEERRLKNLSERLSEIKINPKK